MAWHRIGDEPYLNQCWPDSLTHICNARGRWVNWTLRNIVHWNLNSNINIFIEENHLKMLSARWQPSLSQPQCVNPGLLQGHLWGCQSKVFWSRLVPALTYIYLRSDLGGVYVEVPQFCTWLPWQQPGLTLWPLEICISLSSDCNNVWPLSMVLFHPVVWMFREIIASLWLGYVNH